MSDKSNSNGFPELFRPDQWAEIRSRYGLTGRELDVLRLLTRGMGNDTMAEALGICRPTLRSHLRTVYMKFNRGDRVGVILELVHKFR